MKSGDFLNSWNTAAALALVHNIVIISKDENSSLPPPEQSGFFKRSIGMMKGQEGDWRASIDGSTLCVHLVEYADRYELHCDMFDPSKKLFSHLFLEYLPDTTRNMVVMRASRYIASRLRKR